MSLLKILKIGTFAFGLAMGSTAAWAETYTVEFGLNTAVIQATGPYYLAFQLADGSGTGDGNNTVQLKDFNFNGVRRPERPCNLAEGPGACRQVSA